MKYWLTRKGPEGYKKFYFPSGEMGIELFNAVPSSQVEIYAELCDADSIIELVLLVDALRYINKDAAFILEAPYIPFGRQDRHTTSFNPFSLRAFAKILNSLEFDSVITYDPHSLVTAALINNLRSYDRYADFRDMIKLFPAPIIIAPDSGAEKRAYEFAETINAELMVCSKKRNPKTGNIEGYYVPPVDTFDRNLVVVDDICDGGMTFIKLAENLNGYKSLSLLVTHGIFSKGREVLHDSGYGLIYSVFDFLEKEKTNEN